MTNLTKSIVAPLAFAIPMHAYTQDVKKKPEVFVQQEAHMDKLLEGRPVAEKNKIMSNWPTHCLEKRAIVAQSSVDSLAYRRLFEGTKLVNDSDAVAEFNKITPNSVPDKMWGFPTYSNKMDEILKSHGITQQEIYKYAAENQIGRETYSFGATRFTSRDDRVVHARHQFKVDSVAYRRFFEKHDMMDAYVKKGIKEISKKFKPAM